MFVPEFTKRNARIAFTITAVIAIASMVTATAFFAFGSDSNGVAFLVMTVTFGFLTWMGNKVLETYKEEN